MMFAFNLRSVWHDVTYNSHHNRDMSTWDQDTKFHLTIGKCIPEGSVGHS